MVIKKLKNLYGGVNPHLNSRLQTQSLVHKPSVWWSFHFTFVSHITDALNNQSAPPQNYVTRMYRSLQSPADVPLEYPVPPLENINKAAVILRWNDKGEQIVARIEVIFPLSKMGQAGYEMYHRRRKAMLETGIPLIEIDFLHETAPTFKQLPVYPRDPSSHIYSITIVNPNPSFEQGTVHRHPFDIDEPIPSIAVPLGEGTVIMLDINTVYHKTYRSGLWGFSVDYSQLPARFETYSPADQKRIHQRMKAIAEAQTHGDDLE